MCLRKAALSAGKIIPLAASRTRQWTSGITKAGKIFETYEAILKPTKSKKPRPWIVANFALCRNAFAA